jgi:hypothetical protein
MKALAKHITSVEMFDAATASGLRVDRMPDLGVPLNSILHIAKES